MTPVDSLVSFKGTCMGERLPANIANKGFAASVGFGVFVQVTSLGKHLAANITNKAFVASVGFLVCF